MPIIPNEEKPHKTHDYKPRLRPIEVFPVKIENQEALCLRDPTRISPEPLFLTSAADLFLPLLNGQNDLRDIQAALMRRLGRLIESEIIEDLIEKLDENLFLEGERFDRYLLDLKIEFAKTPIRGAAMAGLSYESDPLALSGQLKAYYEHPSGPGLAQKPVSINPIRGLMAPHIDFERGGPCYAWAYNELGRVSTPPQLVVILGTAHSPMDGYLNLCGKDFETPFGLARCEKDLAEEISSELGAEITADSFIHRGEHSVEFQAVWLKSVFQESDDLRILPFLCGSLIPLIESERLPAEVEEYTHTLDILKKILNQWEKDNGPVMIMASVDLSHVGPQFGHEFRVTESVSRDVRNHDTGLLETVARGDYDGFFRLISDELDMYNVCGVASIYAMLRLLGRTEGSVLSYDQWVDREGGGLVSFASLAFS